MILKRKACVAIRRLSMSAFEVSRMERERVDELGLSIFIWSSAYSTSCDGDSKGTSYSCSHFPAGKDTGKSHQKYMKIMYRN